MVTKRDVTSPEGDSASARRNQLGESRNGEEDGRSATHEVREKPRVEEEPEYEGIHDA